jgi:hypothetical protein
VLGAASNLYIFVTLIASLTASKMEKSKSYFSVLTRLREKKYLGFAIPICIYFSYIIAAHLIGTEYSCRPLGSSPYRVIADLYWWLGGLSLPFLFAIPFIFAFKRHIIQRILLALASMGTGIITWAWAFDSARMVLMCRLF